MAFPGRTMGLLFADSLWPKIRNKLLCVASDLLRQTTSRPRRERVNTAVDLGEIEVPQLLGLSVAGCGSLGDYLKYAMATDFALTIVNNPTTGADHSVD